MKKIPAWRTALRPLIAEQGQRVSVNHKEQQQGSAAGREIGMGFMVWWRCEKNGMDRPRDG